MTATADTTLSPDPAIQAVMDLVTREPLSNAMPFFNYGTAGFRFKADVMDGLMVRVGILGAILLLKLAESYESKSESEAAAPPSLTTGVMITASHNDESYNGVKLANPDGSMLTPPQEAFLTTWVNERDPAAFRSFLEETVSDVLSKTKRPLSLVLKVGRDTRSHSPRLSGLLLEGADSFFGCIRAAEAAAGTSGVTAEVSDQEILTTPMLHHIVLHSNPSYLPSYIRPRADRKGYIETYAEAYFDLLKGLSSSSETASTPAPLRIDGACGVGFRASNELWEELQSLSSKEDGGVVLTPLTVHNGETDGPLNDSCGSEHVQKELQPPSWYSSNTDESSAFPYCCSLDGDADRIVFFGQKSGTELERLLDGDKIAILVAHVLQKKFQSVADLDGGDLPAVKMGIVQTAYANGASTDYVRSTLAIPVEIAKTGVKHLHHAAVEHFDVGIYFEANGHGTVVFSKTYEAFAEKCLAEHGDPFFVQLHRLINPAVGDALSDMLLVDYLLRSLGWTLDDWSKLYEDLPSRMLKVKVADRSVIGCNSNESICLRPESVQPLLQAAMEGFTSGRTFIRPSGTEDVVRVYAEAGTREEADALAKKASKIVFDTCAGVGDRP
mmetsp:Transcript_5035/g.14576  ORF Transcript_5035/g.14576 Transcript_5035/m.14576 type:complete len:612 (+) Transcript_5035:2485-4320(+)